MKTFSSIILAFLVVGLCSCTKETLDKQPLDKISDADVWNDPSLLQGYVNNLYMGFPFNAFSDIYRYSDESSYADRPQTNITQGTVSRNSEGLPYWDYNIVRTCNVFLEKVDATPLTEAEKTRLKSEVRVIRAVVYFEMAKRYGGVPLVLTVLDPFAPAEENLLPRNKEADVYEFIIGELTEAADALTESATPRGRITKWVALAYKSRVCLWAGSIAKYGSMDSNGLTGVPSSLADGYFQDAYDAADLVVKSGNYSLFNKYADKTKNYQSLFIEENHSEVIFHKVFDGENVGHSWDKSNSPPSYVGPGAGKCNPVWELIESYENADGSSDPLAIGGGITYNSMEEVFVKKDPRLNATILYQGYLWQGDTVMTYEGTDTNQVYNASNKILTSQTVIYNGKRISGKDSRYANTSNDNLTKTGFYIRKFRNQDYLLPISGKSFSNWIEIRLAEMYLIMAETAMELNQTDAAVTALNLIRERAGIMPLDNTSITLEKVRHERKIELAFENQRYWDLRRWRTAHIVLNHRFKGVQAVYQYYTKKYYFNIIDGEDFTRVFDANLHYYNPITTARISNMPSLVENPNY